MKDFEDAQLSEADKARKQAEEAKAAREKAEADLRVERTRNIVYRIADEKKVVDLEAVYLFIDQSKVIWKDGSPENIEELVEEVLNAKTYLLPTDNGQQGPSRTSPGAPTRTVATDPKPGLERMRTAHEKKGAKVE